MPPDEKILKSTGLQKITNRYQEVNKNEVKSRRKTQVDVEYAKKEQKMEIVITERTDITPLLGMNWTMKFKLNSQSERENVFYRFLDSFENIERL